MSETNVEISKEARECAEWVLALSLQPEVEQAKVERLIQQAINAAKAPLEEENKRIRSERLLTANLQFEKIEQELSRLKEENERLREASFQLVPVRDIDNLGTAMCQAIEQKHGTYFRFSDTSQHCKGEFQIGNPISRAPDKAIGAVKHVDGKWYWVLAMKGSK